MAEPRFIRFEERGTYRGKALYYILNKDSGDVLGQVHWYGPWRQWVCGFENGAIWSQDCLQDVRAFLLELGAAVAKARGET